MVHTVNNFVHLYDFWKSAFEFLKSNKNLVNTGAEQTVSNFDFQCFSRKYQLI